MKRVRRFAIVVLLLGAGLARPAAAVRSSSETRQVNARQLMRMVESAYDNLMRASQWAGDRLDPKAARNRPFRSALDRMGRSVEEVGTALRARDPRFFQSLERGSVVLGELRVIRARSGVTAPEVDRGLALLASSYRLLRRSYGSEQARHERGGALSESERQRFERIQAAQRDFAARLEVLRRKAEERRDRATVAELNRLIVEAHRIASAPLTLESYLNALIAADEMRGEWVGNRYYAEPADKADWAAAHQVVEELHVEAEVGHLFVMELGKVGDLSQLDEPAELLPGLEAETDAPAVQVFVPVEETTAEGVEIFENAVEEETGVVSETLDEGVASEDIVVEEIPAVGSTAEAPVEEAEEGTVVFEEEVIEEEDLPVGDVEPEPESGPPPPR
ncbi:MAG TPA: hypothetical protein VE685_24295 [Thermoanaerobaculia bacterium]|nr:hypothetical protein [Thermoanaerobaculia bacterium]